jgi:protein phosphatase 2C family protein 2/3
LEVNIIKIRKTNEDKINITLNNRIKKSRIKNDTAIHYFGVFDGHGGSKCAEFLRDNLHKIIFENPEFLQNPNKAIVDGFKSAENIIISKNMEQYVKNQEIDRSGSCANLCFAINDTLYLANLGDSRSIVCRNNFSEIYQLTIDHKPNEISEKKRIFNSGGQLYR